MAKKSEKAVTEAVQAEEVSTAEVKEKKKPAAKAKKEAELKHKKPENVSNPNQNMMYYMLIPILIFSITWPTAMSIYWIINFPSFNRI